MIDADLARALGAPAVELDESKLNAFRRVFSQTHLEERESLFAAARYSYTGEGAVWDLGCAAGGSSYFLAAGLSERTDLGHIEPVQCFDLFEGYSLLCFGSYFPGLKTDLDIFAKNTRPVKDYLVPVKMDLAQGLSGHQPGRAVEIAHIDAAKSLPLWQSIFSTLASRIIPGKTVWIFQDFERARLPWQVYGLWEMLPFGRILGGAINATLYFRFDRQPDEALVRKVTTDDFTVAERIDRVAQFMALIRAHHQAWFRDEIMPLDDVETALKAYCHHWSGERAEARALLSRTSEAYRTQWSNRMYSVEIFGDEPLRPAGMESKGGRGTDQTKEESHSVPVINPVSGKTVTLHVGHGKTGSSYIQSSLAMSVQALAEIGVCYPEHRSLREAALGRITSGNGNYATLNRVVDAELARSPHVDTVLLSHEGFFGDILDDRRPLDELVAKGIQVQIILFIRDPLDHAMSVYAQHVKRGGYTEKFASYLATINVVSFVEKFIRRVRDVGASIKICNYSLHKDDVLGQFCEMLEVPRSRLSTPTVDTINRSLTRSELYLQRKINAVHTGSQRHLLADMLCNDLPHVRSEIPEFTEDEARKFAERMQRPVQSCNKLLPEHARYSRDELAAFDFSRISARSEELSFSKEQVAIISEVLGKQMNRIVELQAPRPTPPPEPAPVDLRRLAHAASLYGIATRIEQGDTLSIAEARTLLTIAHRLRPGGKLIKAKLDAVRQRAEAVQESAPAQVVTPVVTSNPG